MPRVLAVISLLQMQRQCCCGTQLSPYGYAVYSCMSALQDQVRAGRDSCVLSNQEAFPGQQFAHVYVAFTY